MVFPVVGGDGKPTGYEIENSARFDNTGGDALGGTFGTATNEKKFTLSMWHKKSSGTTSGGQVLFGARSGYENIFLHEETMRMDWNNASSGTINWAPLIRDHSAWYHFVLAQDTTQSTNSNRIKFYINGRQITTLRSGVTATYPSQNLATGYNVNGQPFYVSSYNGSAAEINGYLANVQFVDGQQYDPTYFGKLDDNGVWIPVEPGTGAGGTVDYGNNGFLLEFKQTGTGTDANGIGADTSGNDNHLAVTNLTSGNITVDTPTNNFATGNPLAKYINDTNVTYSEGNLKGVAEAVATSYQFLGNFGLGQGKWYWEVKATDVNQNNDTRIGVVPEESIVGITINGEHNQIVYRGDGSVTSTGESSLSSQGNITDGMIVGVALDMDNFTVKWYLNGTLTSTISINSTYRNTNYFPFFRHVNSGTVEFNFGNPSFSISSGNADANGYGNFEYAPPSGYYSICTKNLAEYG